MFALVAAAVLRFAALGQKPLWCDELATLQRLSLPLAEHWRGMAGNHPLYELLLRFWMPPQGSDVWMRIPSAVLGVLAVWMTWLLVRRLGAREGVVAAWLMAVSPLHVMYSRIARPYSLSCVLALASSLALLWLLRRRDWPAFLAYIAATVLMVYSNLLTLGLWIGQALFVLWFYRRRVWRMRVWVAVNAVILALVAAWAFRNFTLALRWSAETQYTAGQLGRLVKACYLALTFCLGETVNPLNLWVVIPAFLGFGVAMGLGLLKTASRRRSMAVFLFLQAATVCLSGIFLGAAAPKHLVILLPAWCGLLALGVVGGRKFLSVPAAALILLTTFASLFNYFTDRQFADADMVTPWREMAAAVERSESSNDAIEIGYQMDRGAYDMFRRYYRGRLQPQYVKFADWRGDLEGLRRTHPRVILLLHDGDPWEDIETWLKQSGARFTVTPFQMEEHTIKELREGFGSIGKYRTPLYRLYVIEAR